MREIKFRAWNTIDKVMITSINSLVIRDGQLLCDGEDIVMQYTGLKDKNGVEIYEGDILKHDNWVEVVKWKDQWDDYDSSFCGYSFSCISPKLYEVVGNIYENPELLEKSDAK